MTGECWFCGDPVALHPDAEHQVCPSCRGRPRSVVLASAAAPRGPRGRDGRPMRPADPELLARAVLALREYVMSDAQAPSVHEVPAYRDQAEIIVPAYRAVLESSPGTPGSFGDIQ